MAISRKASAKSKAGCSSCGQTITLDPEVEKTRKERRMQALRAKRSGYRSMGLVTIEPEQARR